jgi:2Fe-2S ferredoxin
LKLFVELPGGAEMEVDARAGWSVMDAIRDAGVPVRAECGGGKACGTCHVHILSGDADIPEKDEEEIELLSESDQFDAERSRLSCQILCDASFDGLRLALQPDAYEG